MELNQVAESISAINTHTIGIAGEVRCVITGVDGEIKTDTGYQKNLILNQGLDFFGGGNGSSINASCAIGSGNSTPAITQTKLDAFIAIATGTDATSSYSYVDTGDGMYRMWEQKKYRFTGLGDININELGLVSQGTTSADYYLTTRVLPKDSLGAPTSLGLKTGETLDIYYKIHKVADTRDKTFVINVLDGSGGSVPYNVVTRPAFVGITDRNYITSSISKSLGMGVYTGELGLVSTNPLLHSSDLPSSIEVMESYTPTTYKIKTNFNIQLNQSNVALRSIMPFNYFASTQIRFGRVSDDAPLTKTAKDTLSIPLEFSWGRYEGTL